MQSELEPKNPESVKDIIIELANLLEQFAEPDHRWLVGKNTVQRTGVFVRQSQADLNLYSLVFFTPDDICVCATVDMAAIIANPEHHVAGMLVGVCDFLVQKRGSDKPNFDIETQRLVKEAVKRHVDGQSKAAEIVH